jgi:hypothetical protein
LLGRVLTRAIAREKARYTVDKELLVFYLFNFRVGNAILQALQHYVLCFRAAVVVRMRNLTLHVNSLSTAQRARLNVKSDRHTAVKGPVLVVG